MATTARPKAVKRHPKKPARRPAVLVISSGQAADTSVGKLRSKLSLTQTQFARLLPVSVRTLTTLEGGAPPTEPVARRITELDRLTAALSEVIRKESLGKWLLTPNPAFGGLTPLEVVERGEGDRLWETVYFLRSGVAS